MLVFAGGGIYRLRYFVRHSLNTVNFTGCVCKVLGNNWLLVVVGAVVVASAASSVSFQGWSLGKVKYACPAQSHFLTSSSVEQ